MSDGDYYLVSSQIVQPPSTRKLSHAHPEYRTQLNVPTFLPLVHTELRYLAEPAV